MASARVNPLRRFRRAIWLVRSAVTTTIMSHARRFRFEQEWDIVDDDRFWLQASGFPSSSGLLSCHARMNDPFQAPQLCGMPEDQRAQRLPVQRPIRVQHRGPNVLTISRQAGLPGSTTRWAKASASITTAPQRANMCATVLLPVATPPVRPTKIMGREDSTGWCPATRLD